MLQRLKSCFHPIWLPFLLFIAVLSALYAYGAQQTLPSSLTVSGWRVGGLAYTEFQTQWQEQIRGLRKQKVRLTASIEGIPAQELTFEQLGFYLNEEEIASQVDGLFRGSMLQRIKHRWDLSSERDLRVKTRFERSLLARSVEAAWKELYEKQPQNAKRWISLEDEVKYEPERNVTRIDIIGLQNRLSAIVPPAGSLSNYSKKERLIVVPMPIYEERPPVTLESLRKQGVERKISAFATAFPASGEGRIHNIRSAAATIHDMLLRPNEVFDYSWVVQQTETQFGFKEAPVIMGGKLVPGIGGGICQVSTTLYNAVLRSGLSVLERRNHSLPVSYVPLGQDATFASGYINFTFRNTTGSYLLIRTEVTDQDITVKLFGRMPREYTYEIESKVLEKIEPAVKYVHNPKLPIGAREKISDGRPGYVVETYRYKKLGGVVVGQEIISKDRYAAQPAVIATNSGDIRPGPQEYGPQSEHIVEDGVKGPVYP